MASDKGSCFKKLIAGCGCLTFLLVLLAGAGFFLFDDSATRPLEMETVVLTEDSAMSETGNLNLPEQNEAAPLDQILVKLEVVGAALTIVPDGEPDQVNLTGEYDTANYELETHVDRRNGEKRYRVELKPRRRLGLSTDDNNNKLVLHLPRNLPVLLELDCKKGTMKADLAGVRLQRLKAELSMGSYDIRMASPNPIVAENVSVEASMGELELSDFQNFRMKRGSFSARMGNARIYNSGPLESDTQLTLDANLAEVYLQIPENAAVRSEIECTMGDSSTPIRSGEKGDPQLSLEGNCMMGSVRVSTGRSKPKLEQVMLGIWANEGVDAMLAFYLESVKPNPGDYKHSRHSMRGLGYEIMELGRAEDALKVFELNAAEYPDYEKSWRAVGAAHLELGHYQQAIDNLEKALAIDPEYRSARKLLNQAKEKLREQEL